MAMKEETDALVENDTWKLVDSPKNVKVINNRWVLQTKLNYDGLTKWLRARLVAKGLVHKAGINYDEIFSPVACYNTVCAVLAVTVLESLQLCQFYVKAAFQYSTLQVEMYMRQTEGFDTGSGQECKLK